jgi:hypothetical protein
MSDVGLQKLRYDGKPASRQASINASVRAGMTPMAAQYPPKLKDGCGSSSGLLRSPEFGKSRCQQAEGYAEAWMAKASWPAYPQPMDAQLA